MWVHDSFCVHMQIILLFDISAFNISIWQNLQWNSSSVNLGKNVDYIRSLKLSLSLSLDLEPLAQNIFFDT